MDLDAINQKISRTTREYKEYQLNEEDANPDPFLQFILWLDDAIISNAPDPTAMVLATCDEKSKPDTRVVLLKELAPNQFIFYTNYNSKKGAQLLNQPVAALNFYWPTFTRQVRIKGYVIKVANEQNEEYFSTRPRESQLGARAWVQSSVLSDRFEIDKRIQLEKEKFMDSPITCPDIWGGYAIIPYEYEFFQGRKWRFNDRLLYTLNEKKWKMVRLAP